jgi:hypothetical protein
MAAIITSNFRTENANNFRDAIGNVDNSVYLFIGKSDAWSNIISDNIDEEAPTPVDAVVDVNDAWQHAIALKRVVAGDVFNLVNRHDWNSGDVYAAWDDADEDIFSKNFYVITDEFNVYKCIKASPNGAGSTVKPIHFDIKPKVLGDSYVWKYMFSVATADAIKFLTNFYLPVKTIIVPTVGNTDEETKYAYQQDSAAQLGGKIYRYVVTNGGTNYTSPPTVNVYGDGTGAVANAVVVNGIVTEITVTGTGNTFHTNAGSGYNCAYVTLTGGNGSGAAGRAVLSPVNGHGTDPVSELGGYYIGIRTRLTGTENGTDFIVDNSFRQIGIVKNPYQYGTSTIATDTTLKALKGLRFSAHSGLSAGDGYYITGTNSGAVAFVDYYNTGAADPDAHVRYHQNDKTGYTDFQLGETITGSSGGTGTIAAIGGLLNPTVQPFTGNVLFIENRAYINRSAEQIEDIKVIIEF